MCDPRTRCAEPRSREREGAKDTSKARVEEGLKTEQREQQGWRGGRFPRESITMETLGPGIIEGPARKAGETRTVPGGALRFHDLALLRGGGV